ncbi:hypothetical protein BDQ12DRAFT_742260 [Crucibulum laeve]|uniref:SET domain-containing protein n=1 Tax=Crucibulum laeve TaxID=68775 RepID=A0A5C3MJF2_9AGAR|nr:hypothetical protein BDQ12DRAFT_742260 [Crucibulum laeve]
MQMRDLSKDDDFLSHLLVEKLGTGTVPLHVHKMDGSRRLPKTDTHDLMDIVRRLVVAKGPVQHVVRQAVDELLLLPAIRYYLKSYTQKQINAFATHASRYFELYHPSGSIEIAHTSRYSHRTGKSELCILATRFMPPGTVITELKGSMANLTDEEDKELKRTDLSTCDIRRDFSVIHSKQMKKNHLFLGPARFVNHDCDNNCELFREGRYITFRTLRPIAIGEEITAHYGDGYFGKRNRHCLCETCEKRGRGGYAPESSDDDGEPSSDSSSDSDDSDSDSDSSSTDSESDIDDKPKPIINVNERRTRRGVYAVVTKDEDSDESENEEDNKVPLANAKDIPADGEIEMSADIDTSSELTSLTPSMPPSDGPALESPSRALMTPAPEPICLSRTPSSLTSLSSMEGPSSTPQSDQSTPFRSIISTRRQKAQDVAASSSKAPAQSEPLASTANTPSKRLTRSVSSLALSTKDNGKGKEKASATPASTPGRRGRPRKDATVKDDVNVKKEDVETRVLRMRPSTANIADATKEVGTPKEREIPRGPDGKPLPICSTCSNVLPVISVDSKVVWGLGFENSRKKKQKMECPRCIRHFAIYQQPWPCRVAPHGSAVFIPTPREESTPVDPSTRRVSHKVLPVLDRKLAAAASASAPVSPVKRGRPRKYERDEDGRPIKKRRIDIARKGTSDTRSKTHDSDPTEEPVKRKRGRPRLSSPRAQKHKFVKIKVRVKEEETTVQLSPASQPRSTNGRFGKKDKNGDPVSPRAERAAERDKMRGDEDDETSAPTRISPRNKNKRPHSVEDGDGSPRKRPLLQGDMEMQEPEPAHRVLPRPASSFRGGRLFSNPNPLSFALHAWASPVVLDDSSSSEDEKPPVTPEEDALSPAADISSPDEPESSSLYIPVLPRVASIYKPNPLTFAKRRWVSLSTSPSVSALAKLNKDKQDNPDEDADSSTVTTTETMSVLASARWTKVTVAVKEDAYLSEGEVCVSFHCTDIYLTVAV